ncbi:MAG TPA: hypothetical protein VHJ20_05900 [Polyangia bacterium]|nr:hypothetical protein [Polyangia bacterium]
MNGTIVACDASAGSDVIFLSQASALDARAFRALPRARHGRHRILTTETTLARLGAAGERLRPHALLAGFGRPFALGELRLELFPSGHAPGAASLLCERAGARAVYAGVVGPTAQAEVRPADALCLDAATGARRFVFPAPEEARATIVTRVKEASAAGRAPVVLVEPEPALALAAALVDAGLAVRSARPFMQAAAAHARAGLAAPTLARFDGALRASEVLLWPPAERDAARLGALASPFVVLATADAADPAAVTNARAELGVALSDRAGFDELLRYVEATGAREVALVRASGDELAVALRARGVDVYPVGPPRQIALFAARPDFAPHVVSPQ